MTWQSLTTILFPALLSSSGFLTEHVVRKESAAFFRDNIANIRLDSNHVIQNVREPLSMDTFPLPYTAMNDNATVDKEMLRNKVSELKTSTCSFDCIPTTFFKTVFNCLEDEMLAIVKHSLMTGIFPMALKTAIVKPLLKKNNLDPFALNDFKPNSILSFLSKILEKLVLKQLNDYPDFSCTLEKFQSGFCAHHCTRQALVKVVNDLRINVDDKKL